MRYILIFLFALIAYSSEAQSVYGNPNTNPVFGKYPFVNIAKITTATTATHTLPTTNLKLIATGNTNGTKIDWVKFSVDSSASAAVGFIAISDTAGNNPQYFGGVTISATAVSTTAIGAESFLTFGNPLLVIHAGQKVYAGVTVVASGSNVNVAAQIADY